MKKLLIISLLIVCSNAYAEHTYTNEDVLNMVNEPGTVSYAVPPKKEVKARRENPGGIIDCDKAVANQTGQINVGHPEVCIEVPKSYSVPKTVERAIVSSWVGNDATGYYFINENGNIDMSKWKQKLDNN
jgi:hypothetical protein